MRLEGKVALITGAGRGIGLATARLFAREGARLVLCSRTESEILEVTHQLQRDGCQVYSEILDIADPDRLALFVHRGEEHLGSVEILINNASLLGPMLPLMSYSLKEWNQVLTVNLTALFHVTQQVLPGMVARRSGCIINMASGVGRRGRALWGAYSVSKFGVEGLTQVLADELRPYQIRVMALNPGGTRTRMRAQAYPTEDQGRLLDPDRIAQVVLYLVLSAGLEWSGRSLDVKDLLPVLEQE
jgi:NAD(P)-dependent dehydrogenase (short-subunit alcohol dehydrogenase family)